MNIDAEYSKVREQLYQLGFQQPLPIGSLALARALLADLMKTTNNLKQLNEQNQLLLKVFKQYSSKRFKSIYKLGMSSTSIL